MTEKRLRTMWVERQRYRRLAFYAAIGGGVLALLYGGLLARALRAEDGGPPAAFAPQALLALAAGVFLPRWFVLLLWRRKRRLHAQEWE